jgi:hypothetical protein
MERFSRSYPPVVASVGAAVRDVDAAVGAGDRPQLAPRARAVVDELVWNVILHAGGSAAWVQVVPEGGDRLLIEVADSSVAPPHRVEPGPHDIAGRGLIIVDEMADEWGWRRLDIGKLVWARLDATSAKAHEWAELGLGVRAG